MSFRETFINFSLVGIFMLAMITFGVQMTNENSANNTLLDNEFINSTFQNLQTNLSTFQSDAEGQRQNYEAESPGQGFGTLILFGLLGAGKVFLGMVVGINNILFGAAENVLGIDKTVIGVFTAMLLISLIIFVWRLAKTGD